MKKYITLVSFFILLVGGLQEVVAQKSDKVVISNTEKEISTEQLAKRDVYNLNELLNLTSDQKEDLRVLFTEIEEKKISISTHEKDSNKRNAAFKEVEKAKNQRLQQILTEDQYQAYLKSL